MDPIFGKTANPPSIIQNITVGAGLVGSGVTAMEFPSLPTQTGQHSTYSPHLYPSLINKATLGRHKNSDGSPKAMEKTYVNLINPTIRQQITGIGTGGAINTELNFGLGQQHLDVLNPFKIHNGDARITPKGEYEGTQAFKEDLQFRGSNIYKHDNITGKPLLVHNSESSKLNPVGEEGKPILIQKNTPSRPQIKYGQTDIPVFAVGADFTDKDESISRGAKIDWTKNKHLPDESQTKDFIKQVGRYIPEEPNTIENVVKRSEIKRPNLSINTETFETTKKHIDVETFTSKSKNLLDNTVMSLIHIIKQYSKDSQQISQQFSQQIPQQQTVEPLHAPKITIEEAFRKKSLNDSDELYKELLRSYAVALCHYLNNSKKYSKWSYNWKILDNNLKKTNLSVKRLDSSDKDVAYTQNKGDIIKFRWRDNDSYIPRSVFAYVLMHELTHQVFPMTFQGHGDPFPDMLSIVCVAGYELRIFDLKNVPKKTVYSNGQEITSRSSLTAELMNGIKLLREANPNSSDYYDQLEEVIRMDEKA